MDYFIFIQHMLVAFVSYLGLIAGKIMSIISPEEIKPGWKILKIVHKVMIVLVMLSFVIFVEHVFLKFLSFIVFLYSIYAVLKKTELYAKNNYYLLYTFAGLFLGSLSLNSMMYPASLLFILGLPIGILNHKKSWSMHARIFAVFIVFFVIGMYFL